MDPKSELYSVYLSGNGPLVSVLSEALARDRAQRLRRTGEKPSLVECRSVVKAFIQNVHHFRDEYWQDKTAPVEHVALFDEAQRAWTLEQTSKFMSRRKNVSDFGMSEPEFLISCMDRHEDWSVVICLIGAGQEINTGEAGMPEWVAALERSFPNWRVYLSDKLGESEYGSQEASQALRSRTGVVVEPDLHLATSMRSFRAEKVSDLYGVSWRLTPPRPVGFLGRPYDTRFWLHGRWRRRRTGSANMRAAPNERESWYPPKLSV